MPFSTRAPSSIRDAVRRLVGERITPGASSVAIATTGSELVAALCSRLAALVGDSGIGAVLDRALKDSAGWDHGHATPVRRWDAQLEPIRDHLGQLDADAARDACAALLDTFLAMVCTFIGEALTLRLLQELT